MKNENLDVEIDEMTIDDLAPVFHLGEKLFTAKQHQNLYRTWDEYEVTSLYQSEPEFCLVARVDDEVAGFALGTLIEKERTAWNYGYLIWIGVDPEYHRLGLASRLFDRFKDCMKSKGARILMVDTQLDNDKAIRFFKKKGFDDPVEHVYLTYNLDSKR